MRLPTFFQRVPVDEGDRSQYWFARLSSPIIFLILTLAGAGVYLAFKIPVSVFPSTDFPRVVISIDNGVMPIDQMLVTITRPIEEAVNNVESLQQVRSITSRGQAEIDLFFDWNVDMFQTLQRVDSALARVQSTLPATATIDTHRLTFASFPIMGYSLTSQTVPATQLWEMATYEIKPRLNRLDGVATVVVQGGEEPEFHVIPDPAKLLSTSVTVTDILDAIRRTNLVDSPGLLPQGHELYLTLINGQVQTPDQLGNIVVKTTQTGIPVRIGDVAKVQKAVKPVYTMVTANGKPAILININRQPNGNTISVANEVHSEMERIRKTLPAGVTLTPFYDQSEIASESIKSVRDAIILGLILASIIMVLFLRDWGTSIVAGLVIPVTVFITLIILRLLGESFNLMTLGGLAAAVGLVIDDAIVVVENIVLHRDAGQPRLQAIHAALRRNNRPLDWVYDYSDRRISPLDFDRWRHRYILSRSGGNCYAALLTSLILALTWTPNLSQYFISPKPRFGDSDPSDGELTDRALLKAEEASLQGVFGKVVKFYERVLRIALERPKWIAILSVVLIACAYLSYRDLGSDLLPEMDEGGFILDYLMPAGTSLQETNRVLQHVEQILRSIPEVDTTSRRTGLQLGLGRSYGSKHRRLHSEIEEGSRSFCGRCDGRSPGQSSSS